jgi:hypothetical protein
MCPNPGHLPPCPHFSGLPGVSVALDQKATITAKDAFAIVLSDIAVHCHDAIKAKDYARAIVWCEVGLSIVIVDKKVSEIVKGAAQESAPRPFTNADVNTKVRIRDIEKVAPPLRGQVGTVTRVLWGTVHVELSGFNYDMTPDVLERGKHVQRWEAE